MKYIYYDRQWITTDTKARHRDLCGKGFKGFCTAVRVWFWYLGVPARIAFYKPNLLSALINCVNAWITR